MTRSVSVGYFREKAEGRAIEPVDADPSRLTQVLVNLALTASPFQENRIPATPIRDLGLTIAGTPLEEVVAEFQRELERVGIRRLKPDFHLSTEWGVPFDTISIGIPFYLGRPELVEPGTWDTWKAWAGRNSCVICGMRWGTSSITRTGSTSKRNGSSCSGR
jgi:hypothetical protein